MTVVVLADEYAVGTEARSRSIPGRHADSSRKIVTARRVGAHAHQLVSAPGTGNATIVYWGVFSASDVSHVGFTPAHHVAGGATRRVPARRMYVEIPEQR